MLSIHRKPAAPISAAVLLLAVGCASSQKTQAPKEKQNTVVGAEDGTTQLSTAGQRFNVPPRLSLTLTEKAGVTHAEYVDQLTACHGHILWQANGSAKSHETFVRQEKYAPIDAELQKPDYRARAEDTQVAVGSAQARVRTYTANKHGDELTPLRFVDLHDAQDAFSTVASVNCGAELLDRQTQRLVKLFASRAPVTEETRPVTFLDARYQVPALLRLKAHQDKPGLQGFHYQDAATGCDGYARFEVAAAADREAFMEQTAYQGFERAMREKKITVYRKAAKVPMLQQQARLVAYHEAEDSADAHVEAFLDHYLEAERTMMLFTISCSDAVLMDREVKRLASVVNSRQAL